MRRTPHGWPQPCKGRFSKSYMNDMTGGGKGRKIHPGSGRRKAPVFPKGRLLTPADADAVRALLGDRPRQRDMLIEYLHLIQDREKCLPAGLLHGLAEALSIPMAEIYEVASFYAHFDIVKDGEERPPETTIRVCDSLSCVLAGAEDLLDRLPDGRLAGAGRGAFPGAERPGLRHDQASG